MIGAATHSAQTPKTPLLNRASACRFAPIWTATEIASRSPSAKRSSHMVQKLMEEISPEPISPYLHSASEDPEAPSGARERPCRRASDRGMRASDRRRASPHSRAPTDAHLLLVAAEGPHAAAGSRMCNARRTSSGLASSARADAGRSSALARRGRLGVAAPRAAARRAQQDATSERARALEPSVTRMQRGSLARLHHARSRPTCAATRESARPRTRLSSRKASNPLKGKSAR